MKHNELTVQEKKHLRTLFWRSGTVFASFNMVKMEGQCYDYCMFPILNDVYHGQEELRREAIIRNGEFFNTHACTMGLCLGISYAMEKERAANPEAIEPSMITNIKTSLMGPLAGIGDSLFFNTIRVIASGIAISLCAQANPAGILLFILIYGGSFLLLKYYLIDLGYRLGVNAIGSAFQSGTINMITQAASVMGLMMVGALVSQMVSITTPLVLNINGATLAVQEILDAIMPGILKLGLLFLIFAMLKKKMKPVTIILLVLAAAIIGSFLGVF